MALPAKLKQKYLARFDVLIREGENIRKGIQTIPGRTYESWLHTRYDATGGHGTMIREPDSFQGDSQRLVTWRTSCASLLEQALPQDTGHRKAIRVFGGLKMNPEHLDWGIGTLKGLKDDFEDGFLGDVAARIEAEMAGDYMGQAERLLTEGQSGKFDHVPAAVLAGAVLEKALRGMCERQNPPISTVKDNNEPKALNAMIDDLRKVGVYNEAKAKQLRAWADIRNHAAHGRFEEFTKTDVESMLKGVKDFLCEFST